MKQPGILFLAALASAAFLSLNAWGQQTFFKQTNLSANLAGVANHTDPQLSNSWGVAFLPGNVFWIADNNSGVSTLYDAQGNKQALVVTIPSASVQPCSPGCPTGIVANATADFGGAAFLFDTEDGILAAWTGANSANKVVDNSSSGAVYKGLALINNNSGNFLLAANFRSGAIDVFDTAFHSASLAGSFHDSNLPPGFAPHSVHVVNNQVFVAYAMQDASKHDPQLGAGLGLVNVFDLNGNFVKRFASNGALNAPWGVVKAASSFGKFSNAILVGNFGDGAINAFDAASGMPLAQLADSGGHPLINPGLWELVFGQTGTGDPNTLYLTAGGSDQMHGLFASVAPAQNATTADFSLALSTQSASVARGAATSIMIDASGVGGFNSPVALSCTGLPAGISCSFSPATIAPGGSMAASTLTIAVASTYSAGRMIMGMLLPFGLMGLAWMGGVGGRSRAARLRLLALALVVSAAAVAFGCGGNSSSGSRQMAANSTASLMVTGTSGSIVHSVPVTLTVR